jgi:phosphatidylglycerol---prolipoprotein diacylglyceryl transferase
MVLNFIEWTANPVAFYISERGIRWYGILLASGFLLAYLIFCKIAKREGLKQDIVDKFAIYVVLGVVIGLRLGHCFFYNPIHYINNPLEILKVWEGGLASHGGAVGIFVAVWLFLRNYKQLSFLYLVDRLSIIVALAGSFVRVGNLMNHEIVGIPTRVSWAFVFHRVDMLPRHPTQLYEAIFYFLFFIIMYWLYMKKDWGRKQGLMTGFFFVIVFTFRFLIEFTKTVQMETESWDFPLLMGQLLSVPFVIIGIVIMLKANKKPKMKYFNE